jgi:hypothetical protein
MIQNHKDRLARLIKAHLGNEMNVTREKLACRWERSTI